MKLSQKQISKIDKKIILDEVRRVVEVDVSHKSDNWPYDEIRNNIYCIDDDYNIIWQVSEDEASRFADGDPFCYLGFENNEVVADRFSGFEYKIDAATGKVTRTGFHK